jgi:flagellar protein FliS
MLYDEAIKQIGTAYDLFEGSTKLAPSNIEILNKHILKSQEIITELMASLNMDAGGDISKNLLSLYTYFNQQLFEGNVEKNPDKLKFVKNMMEELRSAWIEIVNNTAVPAPLQSAPAGINIAG